MTCPNSTLLQKEIKAAFSVTKFLIMLLAKWLGATSNEQYSMAEKINSKQDAEYRIQDFYMHSVPIEVFYVCVEFNRNLLLTVLFGTGSAGSDQTFVASLS